MSEPIFILAPMDDVTDTVFRRIVTDCAAPDFTVTEFVNVDGLCSVGRERLLPKLNATHDAAPVIAQIWGKQPDNFRRIAREVATGEIPGFYGVDLNFGCPDKAVVKNECCSALAQPDLRQKALDIVAATQQGIAEANSAMPLSIKTRLGFSAIDYTWHEALLACKPAMLTIHVRTTKQMSKVPAQWEAITPIITLRDQISPSTKIILNGDIMNRTQGLALVEEFGVDGCMIGRGVFHDPYCFADTSPWATIGKEEKVALFKKHLTLFNDTYQVGTRKFAPLKKFAKIYISGFAGASELREQIMNVHTVEEALGLL